MLNLLLRNVAQNPAMSQGQTVWQSKKKKENQSQCLAKHFMQNRVLTSEALG